MMKFGCEMLENFVSGHAPSAATPSRRRRPSVSLRCVPAMEKPAPSFHEAVYRNEIDTVRAMLQRDPKRAYLGPSSIASHPLLCGASHLLL